MQEKKVSNFQNVLMILIAMCAVAITAIMVYQLTLGSKQIELLETELHSYQDKLESQATALTAAEDQLGQYESQLAQCQDQLAQYEKQIKDMLSKEEKALVVSSTKEYAAWVAAQSALEPYDLFIDLQFAYDQLVELDSDYLIGSKKYETALNLLVPKKEQNNLDSYWTTLRRYFDTTGTATATNRFIDDLVSAKIINETKNGYYTWNTSTFTTKNVMSKLNLTEDVANALMGLLRSIDWDV